MSSVLQGFAEVLREHGFALLIGTTLILTAFALIVRYSRSPSAKNKVASTPCANSWHNEWRWSWSRRRPSQALQPTRSEARTKHRRRHNPKRTRRQFIASWPRFTSRGPG
jgi:hypothetical protein